MPLRIRPLRPADVPRALALSRQAGWNQVAADWHRLLELSPDGCFGGWLDGTLIATSTLVIHGKADAGPTGWIGMVLVDEAHRREGYGTRLFERALERATAAGVSDVGLNATDEGRSIYVRSGFVEVARIRRWHGPLSVPSGDRDRNRIVTNPAPERLLDRDRAVCGVDRGAVIGHLQAEPDTRSVAAVDRRSGDCRGYAIVRPGRDAHQIGPLIATDGSALTALLAGIADRVDPPSVVVDVLDAGAAPALRAAGLAPEWELVRMRHDARTNCLVGDGVVGAVGLEFG